MKKALILILLSSTSLIVFAQTFSSSLLSGQDYVLNGDIVQFDNKNIIVASETCNGLTGTGCTYIFEVNEDNSISRILDIGTLELFNKTISSNDEFLTVVGLTENNELRILKYNTSFELVNQAMHSIGNSAAYWIFDIIEFANAYVVAVFSIGDNNFPSLIKIDASDLSLIDTYLIEENESCLKEMTVDANNNLKVVKSQNGIHEVITLNTELEELESWSFPDEGAISFLNFELTNSGDLLLGLNESTTLVKYDTEGELVWQKNVASQFGAEEIQFIRELKEISNGDILLCGSLEKENENFGFIYSLQSNGQEKWKRLYKIDNSVTTNPLKGFIELEGGNFMFYGSLRLEPLPAQNTFHDTHWVLRTDSEGCIDSGCGEELPVKANEIEDSKISIFPNPTSSIIKLNGLEIYSTKEIIISDLTGRTVLHANIQDNLITISSLESGIYFLQILIDKNLKLTEKIIKI